MRRSDSANPLRLATKHTLLLKHVTRPPHTDRHLAAHRARGHIITVSQPHRRALVALMTAIMVTDASLYGLVVPFLSGHARGLGLSEASTGLLYGTYAVGQIAASALLLVLVKHVSIPRIVFGGSLLMTVSAVAFALASSSIPGLFAARTLQGAAAAVPWVLGPALVAASYPASERGAAMGLLSAGAGTGVLIGPPLGGVLYEYGGFALPMVLPAVVSFILALLAPAVLRDLPGADTFSKSLPLGAAIGSFPVRAMCLLILLCSAVLSMLEIVMPLQYLGQPGFSPTTMGLIFGVAVLFNAVFAPVAGHLSDRYGRVLCLACGLGSVAVMVALAALITTPATAYVVMGFFGIAYAFAFTPIQPMMADEADRRSGGAPSSAEFVASFFLSNLAYSLGVFLGPVAGGTLSAALGSTTTLLFSGGACAAGLVFVLLWSRRLEPDRAGSH